MASHVFDIMTNATRGTANPLTEARVRFSAWRKERAYRSQIARELATYSNRELFDLGISRGDIPAVINGTYRR